MAPFLGPARPHRARVAVGLLALAGLLAACAGTTPDTGARPNTTKPAVVDASLGGLEASEFASFSAVGQSWNQLLYRQVIGTGGVFYDFASPSADLASVLAVQVPEAIAVHARLVTVFVAVRDLYDNTTLSTYGRELAAVIDRLRAAHATVLVANAVPLQVLPSYVACVKDPASCGAATGALPGPATVGALVAGYDREIAAVVRAHGARLVDVNRALAAASARGGAAAPFRANPAGGRGFNLQVRLSPAGAALIAATFAALVPSGLRR